MTDATPVEASQSGSGKGKDDLPKKDPEAGWHVKNDSRGRQKSTYGYSVHTGVDENGFIHSQCVTTDNVHDSQERDSLILEDEAKLYAEIAATRAGGEPPFATYKTHYGLTRTRFIGLAKRETFLD
ncbi:transposase [Marinomonas algicola]|uniref:transposase n=1 Tax=Marinomonas algicola TaxID=2773454 RepID=UPI001EFF2548|nr:transposase [Marinomonas algicola]